MGLRAVIATRTAGDAGIAVIPGVSPRVTGCELGRHSTALSDRLQAVCSCFSAFACSVSRWPGPDVRERLHSSSRVTPMGLRISGAADLTRMLM